MIGGGAVNMCRFCETIEQRVRQNIQESLNAQSCDMTDALVDKLVGEELEWLADKLIGLLDERRA